MCRLKGALACRVASEATLYITQGSCGPRAQKAFQTVHPVLQGSLGLTSCSTLVQKESLPRVKGGIGWLGSLGSSSMGNLYSLATVSESTVFDPQQRKWGGPDGLLSLYFQHVAENRTSQGLDVSRSSKEEARKEAHSESEQQRCGTWVG